MSRNPLTNAAVCMAAIFAINSSAAATPTALRDRYAASARATDPGYGGPSTVRGEQFFKSTHGREWSCASCHGARPVSDGKHAVTGKIIAPLAPSAHASRFTDPAKTEKWFKRNCNDVLGRQCNAAEKGDVLEYLLTLNRG